MSAGLKSLLAEYADLPEFIGFDILEVNCRGHFGNTPLHVAVVRGNPDEVRTLLAAGADISASGEHGYTPLHEAVGQGHREIVELLLAFGAPRDARSTEGYTPRDLALISRQTHLLGIL